ncbi:MAG: multiheme c-type cytochrome [Anaerolineae bacterium]
MRRSTALLGLIAALFLVLLSSVARAQGPNYVGSRTCGQCHASKYAAFQETWHPRMLREASDEAILGDFTSRDPDLTFSRHEVRYVIGGQYKQRYLTEIEGELYVLPAEWNVVAGEWMPYHPADWRARPYRRLCAGCHTTGYDPWTGEWSEMGVWCEACHGPGGDHVASTGNRTMIVNPARLDFESQAEVCGQCHSRGHDPSGTYPFPVGFRPGGPTRLAEAFIFTTDPGDFWPDGSAKKHHMQYLDWQKGEHARSVNCIFCHVSHSKGETDHQTRMVGNHRCIICHESKRDQGAHIPFMKDVPVFCTDCHMPAISQLVVTDFQIRSHTFWPPDPRKTMQYGGQEVMPTACYICHTDKPAEWAAAVLGLPLSASAVQAATQVETPAPTALARAPAETPVPARVPAETEEASGANPRRPALVASSAVVLGLLGLGAVFWTRRRGRRAEGR